MTDDTSLGWALMGTKEKDGEEKHSPSRLKQNSFTKLWSLENGSSKNHIERVTGKFLCPMIAFIGSAVASSGKVRIPELTRSSSGAQRETVIFLHEKCNIWGQFVALQTKVGIYPSEFIIIPGGLIGEIWKRFAVWQGRRKSR